MKFMESMPTIIHSGFLQRFRHETCYYRNAGRIFQRLAWYSCNGEGKPVENISDSGLSQNQALLVDLAKNEAPDRSLYFPACDALSVTICEIASPTTMCQ